MSNAANFYALKLDSPNKLSHFYECRPTTTVYDIWDKIIPKEAPNDLWHRLTYGPNYVLWRFVESRSTHVPVILRNSNVVYKSSELYKLLDEQTLVFEIEEWHLLQKYMDHFLRSPDDQVDSSLAEAIKKFHDASTKFFRESETHFDAVLAVYDI